MTKTASSQDPQRVASPPRDAKVINVISISTNICNTSHSSAKRQEREPQSQEKMTRSMVTEGEEEITFDDDDLESSQDPHDDGLMVTMYVANHLVRRILIDGGSSANIIQLGTLKRMNVPESMIVPNSVALVGFSGHAKGSLGEIKLPVYIEGVNSVQKFHIIDSMSS